MSTHDIRLHDTTLLVANDPDTARRIVAVLEGERVGLRNVEGLAFSAVETDRDHGDAELAPVEVPDIPEALQDDARALTDEEEAEAEAAEEAEGGEAED